MACLIILYKYPFHADAHKRDTNNLIHIVINTLEAQDHICKGPKVGLPKRASMVSLFGDSFAVGPGDTYTRSGRQRQTVSREADFVSLDFKHCKDTGEKREEKEKDEKQSETNDDLRQLSETPFADFAGVSSSERLLPSSTPTQDQPAFTVGARRVIPSTSLEEDKSGAEGVPGPRPRDEEVRV
ncbi:response to drug [Desmophyllum pertusum]|uniref:Response to drug n=1 Tax=Desmophyllum pertusum TaxID=174260 RepID=A0A9W9YS69_9CNID|nr:response to drug [Desmophyllum pertusum]